jgi:hypothetical protein
MNFRRSDACRAGHPRDNTLDDNDLWSTVRIDGFGMWVAK